VLPEAGGQYDQSPRFIEAADLVTSEISRLLEAKHGG
jgi:hypothetical protein